MTSPELDPNVTAAIRDSFSKQGLMTTIGAELHLVTSGEVRLRINASESLTQHHGFLHCRGPKLVISDRLQNQWPHDIEAT